MAVAGLAGLYAARIFNAIRLMRHAREMKEAFLLLPGFADGSWVNGYPHKERLEWATTTLHNEEATQAEREKAALNLGYRSADEALLPENAGKPRPIAASILRDVFAEDVAAIARILGNGSTEQALRSEAYDAVVKRGKPATPPSFPDKPDDEPPHQYIGAYGTTGPQA